MAIMKHFFLSIVLALFSFGVNAQMLSAGAEWTRPFNYYTLSAGHNNSSTTLNVSYPAAISQGDLILLHIAYKYSSATVTPTGFTLLTSLSAGSGSNGEDSGTVVSAVYYRVATGAETPGGTFSVTFSSGSVITCRTYGFRKDPRHQWSWVYADGSDVTGNTTWSVTTGGISLKVGDILCAFSAHNFQTPSWGTATFTQTGSTFSSVTNVTQGGTSAGDNARNGFQFVRVNTTSGASNAVTVSAGTATGPMVLIALRQTL
jgi:hypothetical protein